MRCEYESLAWLNDKNGKEYVCLTSHSGDEKSCEQLLEDENKQCADVNKSEEPKGGKTNSGDPAGVRAPL